MAKKNIKRKARKAPQDVLTRQERMEKIQSRLDELNDILGDDDDEEDESEKRAWTTEEGTEARELMDELEEIEEIEATELRMKERAKRSAKTSFAIGKSKGGKTPEQRLEDAYSVTRHVVDMEKGRMASGSAESEVQAEAERIARQAGLPVSNRGIMTMFSRQANTTTPASAGNLIGTNQMALIEGYAPNLVLDKLGITKHMDLLGVNNFPVADYQAQSAFVGEQDASTEVDVSTRRPIATAKALRTKTAITWQMMAAAGSQVDQLAMTSMSRAESNTINKAMLIGGAANENIGVLADSDVPTISLGANGGLFDFNAAIDVQTSIHDNDASAMGSHGYVTTPGARGKAQKTRIEAGQTDKLWNYNTPNLLMGLPAEFTSLMPSDGTKGTGTNLHALIYGAWAQLHVCNWQVREIFIDKVTDDHQMWLKMISFWDAVVANPKAFAKILDIDITVAQS